MTERMRLLAVMLLLTGVGCSATGGEDRTVAVFAAASLSDAFIEVVAAFESAQPGIEVELNLAGSSTLREQVLDGAPADVFASADEIDMATVEDAGEVQGEVKTFARNRMEIAVPTGNPGEVRGLADFEDADLLIGLCAEEVPCGRLGREVLANAGVEPALDTNEPDVRALLTKIEVDELDAGLVYVTDVAASGGAVQGIEVPPADNVIARYPIAALSGAPDPEAASLFVEFVLSDGGQAILADFGFGAP